MIVDDSLTARTALQRMVEGVAGLEVAAVANSAENALEALRRCPVDVILLDLEMPGMSGIEALPRIMARADGARVLVVSSSTVEGAEQTLEAMSLGAADTMPKPDMRVSRAAYRETLLAKIHELGLAARIAQQNDEQEDSEPVPSNPPASRGLLKKRPTVLAIGASTGGIHALTSLFNAISEQLGSRRLGLPILVTQHLPHAFMAAFARQLENASGYDVVSAEEGTVLEPNRIFIAPGDAHIMVRKEGDRLIIRLNRSPSPSGCMPSVDPMFTSLAHELGDGAFGIILSGMGRDGLRGAARIVEAGGAILAQDEATCAVWGMPRAVAEAGLATAVLPPREIARLIANRVTGAGVAACR